MQNQKLKNGGLTVEITGTEIVAWVAFSEHPNDVVDIRWNIADIDRASLVLAEEADIEIYVPQWGGVVGVVASLASAKLVSL